MAAKDSRSEAEAKAGAGAAAGSAAGSAAGAGGWSHVDAAGDARMVDVSGKTATLRRARAEGFVRMRAETRRQITSGENPKGSVLGTARIAGIAGAKQTSHLIPLCHPLPVEKVRVDFAWDDAGAAGTAGAAGAAGPAGSAGTAGTAGTGETRLRIESEVVVTAKTGVEMEALTAVSIAALTVYDMAKGADPAMVIEGIRLVEKTGGERDVRLE